MPMTGRDPFAAGFRHRWFDEGVQRVLVKLLRGRIGTNRRREAGAGDTPPRQELEQAEIDDQIAALREAVEVELGARERNDAAGDEGVASIVAIPLGANGHLPVDAPARPPRVDRYAVISISRTLAFWAAGLAVGALVGILVAYVTP